MDRSAEGSPPLTSADPNRPTDLQPPAGHMRQGVKCKLCKISCHNDCQSKAHATIKCQVRLDFRLSRLTATLGAALF